jgi:hypothetical protein
MLDFLAQDAVDDHAHHHAQVCQPLAITPP